MVYECPKGSSRLDVKEVTEIFQIVNPDLPNHSICDCTRLGHRTIKELCQFLITERNCPGVSIKPLLTKEQLSIEAILLKERWKLIQSGSSSQLGQCLNNDTFFRRKPSTGTGYLRALDNLPTPLYSTSMLEA